MVLLLLKISLDYLAIFIYCIYNIAMHSSVLNALFSLWSHSIADDDRHHYRCAVRSTVTDIYAICDCQVSNSFDTHSATPTTTAAAAATTATLKLNKHEQRAYKWAVQLNKLSEHEKIQMEKQKQIQ